MNTGKKLQILGTRGIPARHGGFETFAERLALYLVDQGWDVTVYCHEEGTGEPGEAEWRGVRLVHIPVAREGAVGTIIFDWKSTLMAARREGLILTLGYNTALFNLWYRLRGKRNLVNMDGLEWQRDKWGRLEKAWLYLNERLGCWFGNHLIADHPEIQAHLQTRVSARKITMIPYGAERVTHADSALIAAFGLQPQGYAVVIARPEPENSLLEIVAGFSRKPRGLKLVVLGQYKPQENPYHRQVLEAASEEVLFPGAIYDKPVVEAFRFFAGFYVHGHTVGGTNPSLVEALGCGLPVLAHDNPFNRWVAGSAGVYFKTGDFASALEPLLGDDNDLARMRTASVARFEERFTWQQVLAEYEQLLTRWS